MKFFASLLLTMVLLVQLPAAIMAQTCSCAGAPLLGTQSTGASGEGNLLIGLTYEFNQITNLYTGSTRITNDTVERNTQSALLEINYGITDRFSLSGTMSFVQKFRESGISNPGGSQTSTTNGIGDGILLLRYVLSQQSLWNRYHLALGAGTKAPLGSTSVRNPNGLLFNADHAARHRSLGRGILEPDSHLSAAPKHYECIMD